LRLANVAIALQGESNIDVQNISKPQAGVTYHLKGEQVRLNNPFCAINANLESVEFDKSTQVPIAGKSCGD
jgi:hypothetical protein